ncbi:MAG TPA: phospholipid carrier-dependent glycosyltransferase [Candidatus Omnitrophota bacterium]|nr:phospholipid carrier-dependent glycosyltransferase [Candidatus Omnitrophota bacterium]
MNIPFKEKIPQYVRPWLWYGLAFLAYSIFYGYRLDFPSAPYFDEIHYVEAARNLIERSGYVGEAHPYFGKYLIALSIAIFGDHAVAWRLPSFLSGFGIFVMVYLLADRLFQSRRAAWIAVFLLVFDGVFYTLARCALFNSVMLFLMLLSMYFFFNYALLNKWNLRTSFLLSGISAGLAVGTRWVALALFILYAPLFLKLFLKSEDKFGFFKKTLLYFVLPAVTVYASLFLYIPFVRGYDVSAIWRLQEAMLRFHSTLSDYDSRAAAWWTWPLMLKPTWFYVRESAYVSVLAHHSVNAILCIGNPATFWSLPIVVFLSYIWRSAPKKILVLLLLGYMSQWLPWSLLERNQYFHYVHEIMPFGAMILALFLDHLWKRFRWGRWAVLVYLTVVLTLFIYWFPLLNGTQVSGDFFRHHLWLPGWYP